MTWGAVARAAAKKAKHKRRVDKHQGKHPPPRQHSAGKHKAAPRRRK